MSFTLPRELLKDRAYRELIELIQTGVITSEMAISERQLVERLGMSKTPIRTALENLEMQGLVTVSPQRGIFIRELSAREVGELFEVRNAIEPFIAARLATRSLQPEQVTALNESLIAQNAAAKNEDAIAATRLDIEFHRLLGELLGNRELNAWLEKCFDKLQRSVLRVNRTSPGRLLQNCEEHAAVANAIVGGDSDLAAQKMRDHLRFGAQYLIGMGND